MKNEEYTAEESADEYRIDPDGERATKELVQFFDSELNTLLNQAKLHTSLDNATLHGAMLLVMTDLLIASAGKSTTKELFNIARQVVASAKDGE